ncbi:glycosyltransferase family 9 protein [Flavobacterium glaciei]|uniref:ADP-heptose:LPS heptosyltransferase n=1 Tax=Flavobacterium glaciei TaxID=386300 RepID=A0A562PQZ7_9FLAO|nr:glycosyltransferase family 9 protein [Flavobacterium glaciei]RDI53657.1 ADP-heptose:LPS heptosyltransferase [Flavobacterium glaciei]TWI46884.1 ADP-heptose:LPS heptosyltransferase [Flavobacterium glaciei]
MSILKKVNVFRRIVTHGLTKNIGSSQKDYKIDLTQKVEIKRVLISRPNHRLGNLLLITPLVQDIITTFPDCKIDLFVKGGLAPIVFENYTNINYIIELPKKPFKNLIDYFKVWVKIKKQKYDIVINVDKNSSSGRLSAQFADAKYKFFGEADETLQSKHSDYEHIAKYPVYEFRSFLTKLGFPKNENPVPPLDLKLSAAELAKGKKIVDNIVPNNKKTIAIFTYATDDKCYSETWWEEFYGQLKTKYEDYNILEVLPVENISQIGFKAPTFYSKDIREIGSVIANTEIFIGADSGIMHLASASQTPTVGLFSRPNINMYKPYHNNSVAINTNTSTIEESIKVINDILGKN